MHWICPKCGAIYDILIVRDYNRANINGFIIDNIFYCLNKDFYEMPIEFLLYTYGGTRL